MAKNWTPSLFTAFALSSAILVTGSAHSDVSSMSQSIQGAESDVKGSLKDVNLRALSVFKEEHIQQVASSSKNIGSDSGATQTLKGKKGEMTVEIQLSSAGTDQTHVGVVAKQSPIKWNKDFANEILNRIVSKG